MQESLAEKLKDEIGTAEWPLLKLHADRGGLLMIHPQPDLLDVAVQVAEDQTEQVRSWLDSGKISRPPLAASTFTSLYGDRDGFGTGNLYRRLCLGLWSCRKGRRHKN